MANNLNSGVLFKNENPTSDKAPAYSGTVNVNGKDMRVVAWVNETKSDEPKKYFSLKFEEPREAGQPYSGASQGKTTQPTGYTNTPDLDTLPF